MEMGYSLLTPVFPVVDDAVALRFEFDPADGESPSKYALSPAVDLVQ